MEVLSILYYPLLACVLLILIHTYFGMHILERGIVFVDLSLAQFIGIGIAWSCLLGHESTPESFLPVAFAAIGAFILSWSRRIATRTNLEAFIGVLYIFSLALSILLLDRTPHGVEEFGKILNGNILWVTGEELAYTFVLYGVIGIFHYYFRDRFSLLSRQGAGSFFWEFLFFLSFALVLVKSVQLAGILQVFSFLIIPVLIGRLFTKKFHMILWSGWLLGFTASSLGLFLSYYFDLPTAPLIVVFLGGAYFLLLAVAKKK